MFKGESTSTLALVSSGKVHRVQKPTKTKSANRRSSRQISGGFPHKISNKVGSGAPRYGATFPAGQATLPAVLLFLLQQTGPLCQRETSYNQISTLCHILRNICIPKIASNCVQIAANRSPLLFPGVASNIVFTKTSQKSITLPILE